MKTGLVGVAVVAAFAVSGCGGGSSGSAGGTTGTVTPAPGPAPSPAPTPAPTPTPVPTPANPPGGEKLAGVTVPGTLETIQVCAIAPRTVSAGKVTSIDRITKTYIDATPISVSAQYSYAYDINGFGGPTFGPSSRVGGTAFEVFAIGTTPDNAAELQFAKLAPLTKTTLGLTTYYDLCFFAGGPFTSTPGGRMALARYAGFVDGITQTNAGVTTRLYGSTATLTRNTSTGAYDLVLDLKSVANAFAEPAGQAQVAVGQVTASLTYGTTLGFTSATIMAPGGYTGTISGLTTGALFEGALLRFDLVNPAGDRILGVIAADVVAG